MAHLVVVHGPPGSGKTTLASRFKEQSGVNVEHISIGDYLRSIRSGQKDSMFKNEVDAQAAVLAESKPLAHETVNGVIFEFLRTCPSASYVLIDGYPRHLDQLGIFFSSILTECHEYLGAIYLELSRKSSMERLLDRPSRLGEKVVTENFVEWRLDEYKEKTVPVIKELQQHGETLPVNAEASLDLVFPVFSHELLRIISSLK